MSCQSSALFKRNVIRLIGSFLHQCFSTCNMGLQLMAPRVVLCRREGCRQVRQTSPLQRQQLPPRDTRRKQPACTFWAKRCNSIIYAFFSSSLPVSVHRCSCSNPTCQSQHSCITFQPAAITARQSFTGKRPHVQHPSEIPVHSFGACCG